MDVLDLRQLNRATLARQGLLQRERADVVEVIERVGGLQAQRPAPPFGGLWARIEEFEPSELLGAIADGRVVRGTLMRGTLHLWSARDYRALVRTVRPRRTAEERTKLHAGRGVDAAVLQPALALAREAYANGHCTAKQVRELVRAQLPDIDSATLSEAVWGTGPLLMQHVADAPHGYPNVAGFTAAERLLDGPLDATDKPAELLRRYLAAFGPASVADAQAWSGRSGLGSVARAMLDRGELVEFVDIDGRDLVDLPDAPRPSGSTPAPVRFLPLWDTALLGYTLPGRARVYDPAWQSTLMTANGILHRTFLVDGFVHGTWTHTRDGDTATLQLQPLLTIPASAHDDLVRESEALLAFLEPEAAEGVVRLG